MLNLNRILIPGQEELFFEESNRCAIQGFFFISFFVIQPEPIQRKTTSSTLKKKCLKLRSFLYNALKKKSTMKNSFDCASN